MSALWFSCRFYGSHVGSMVLMSALLFMPVLYFLCRLHGSHVDSMVLMSALLSACRLYSSHVGSMVHVGSMLLMSALWFSCRLYGLHIVSLVPGGLDGSLVSLTCLIAWRPMTPDKDMATGEVDYREMKHMSGNYAYQSRHWLSLLIQRKVITPLDNNRWV